MAKRNNSNRRGLWAVGILALFMLPLFWAAKSNTFDPEVLAYDVRSSVICPDGMRPMLVCPLSGESQGSNLEPSNVTSSGTPSLSRGKTPWWRHWGWWRRRETSCNWQCSPVPSISVTPRPRPTCAPRPACLDATPPCEVPEPSTGWCKPQPTPSCKPKPPCVDQEPRCLLPVPPGGWCEPGVTVTPKPTGIYCLDVICPLNCTKQVGPEGCDVCKCSPVDVQR